MDFDLTGQRLLWPADVVLGVLDTSVRSAEDSLALERVLEEAFVNPAGLPLSKDDSFPPSVLASLRTRNVFDDERISSAQQAAFDQFVRSLRLALRNGAIPLYTRPLYYTSRTLGSSAAPPTLSGKALVGELLNVLGELDQIGYFDGAFGSSCSDARFDRQEAARDLITGRLGKTIEWSWPPGPNDYDRALVNIPLKMKDERLFGYAFDLLEVCHDLAARPRLRHWHEFGDEWDYSDFDRPAGQLVYRWRINTVLERTELDLRLAGGGPDVGRLVHTPTDPRSELVDRALASQDPKDGDRVVHAVSRFRARAATRQDKRDALKALGDILESRREVVRTSLGSKDEGALFTILNQFDVRHHNSAQHSDYGEDFLDWVFWTLLATVEFTTTRLARQGKSGTP